MHKFLKLSAVSIVAIVAASNANAAGYTCEELVEYTSCNPGYYLGNAKCPADTNVGTTDEKSYKYAQSICVDHAWDVGAGEGVYYGYTEKECSVISCIVNEDYDLCMESAAESGSGSNDYYEFGCVEFGYNDGDGRYATGNVLTPSGFDCVECPAGSSCAGGTATAQECYGGTYQPNTGQSSCLTTPAGNYSGGGATNYTACAAGKYQPSAGQSSCLRCPVGSYCATTGLTAVSGVCADGSYATGGATSCTQCLATGLIDANGNEVLATTGGTGAGSLAACYVSPDTHFKNDKGTYHYKSDCSAYNLTPFDSSTATEEEIIARCTELGGDWGYSGWYGYDVCSGDGDVPSTEEECSQVSGSAWWEDNGDGTGYCVCDVWHIDLNTGKFAC